MNVIHDEDFDEALDHLDKDFHYLNAAKRKKEKIQSKGKVGPRERERQLRESLQSRHGPTAEIHDQVSLHI